MRTNKSLTEKPIGKLTRIEDFLPSPDKLVVPEEAVKVTICLNKTIIDFFKTQAQKNHTKYQKLIRTVLEKYSTMYS